MRPDQRRPRLRQQLTQQHRELIHALDRHPGLFIDRQRVRRGGCDLGKRVHPHSFRHTTAVYLLKAGVDFATINQWLGHASLNTTIRHARADMDLKRQALSQVFPETLADHDRERRVASHAPMEARQELSSQRALRRFTANDRSAA